MYRAAQEGILRTVALKFHVVAKATADMPFPVDELKWLYATAGIELDLSQGDTIEHDPMYYPAANYKFWVEQFGKKDRGCGHLIIGLHGPYYRSDIPGRLVDLDYRGVAAVYTSCDYIQRDGEKALLQTCAHEIGHMLNLAHEDVTTDFISTMDQAEKRGLDTRRSWEAALAEAQHKRDPYFFQPVRELNSYPFALRARNTLNTLPVAQLLPWGGKFEHPYDEINDVSLLVRELNLRPEGGIRGASSRKGDLLHD